MRGQLFAQSQGRRLVAWVLALVALGGVSSAMTGVSLAQDATLKASIAADTPRFPTAASDGAIWFTALSSAGRRQLVVKRVNAFGTRLGLSLPGTSGGRFEVAGAAAGRNGAVWVSLRGRKFGLRDRLLLISPGLKVQRVRLPAGLRVRNLASAPHGRVWARSFGKIALVDTSGVELSIALPKKPAITQIVGTSDGAAWGVGSSGVVRVSPRGSVSRKLIFSFQPMLAPSGTGVWLGGEPEVVYVDRHMKAQRYSLPEQFIGNEVRAVFGIATNRAGDTFFVSGTKGIAKDVIHVSQPRLGVISKDRSLTETPLPKEFDVNGISDEWEQALEVGSPLIAVSSGPSFWISNFGPGVAAFSLNP